MVKLRDTNTDAPKPEKAERVSSLDAARGVVLLLFVSGGFGLKQLLPDERWNWITNQWTHRSWEGCTLWDLLCPAMLFFVGIAMPYSYANRQAQGQNWFRQCVHAFKRAILLVLIGMYLDAYKAGQLVFDVRGDLQQIGIAYLLAFLVMPLGKVVQGVTVAFMLVGQLAAFVIYAIPSGHDFWGKDHNVGIALDQSLHIEPHPEHFVTFNLLGATAIVLVGVLVAGLIRSGLTPGAKVAIMTAGSFFGIFFGWVLSGGNGWIELSWFAVVPMIRALMTWTFILTAVGCTLLLFTYFYLVMDGLLLRGWAIPVVLVGRNALLVYVAVTLAREWAVKSARLVLPSSPPMMLTLQPLLISLIVLAIFWILCFWLYRRRIFFKV